MGAGAYYFQGMSDLGRGIGRGIEAIGQRHEEKQNILKESQGRGKAIVAALEGLETLGVVPEGASLKVTQAQENMAPRAFLAFVDQQAKQLSSLIQGGVEMKRLEAEKAAAKAPNIMALAALQNAFPAEKFDASFLPVASQPGMVEVKSVSPRAPVQTRNTPVPVGDKVLVFDAAGNVVNREDASPAIPAGYQRDPKGGLAPIPGGPAEAEAEKQKLEQATAAERQKAAAFQSTAQVEVMLNAIGETLPKISPTTSGIGALLSALPGSPAYDLAAKLDTLRANIGFQQLAQMRAASPTGGALGQVAVKELDFLQAALGNLDKWQSPKQLRETILKIQTHLRRWQEVVKGGNPDAKGDGAATQPTAPTAPAYTLPPGFRQL